jgi:hypothetical protein
LLKKPFAAPTRSRPDRRQKSSSVTLAQIVNASKAMAQAWRDGGHSNPRPAAICKADPAPSIARGIGQPRTASILHISGKRRKWTHPARTKFRAIHASATVDTMDMGIPDNEETRFSVPSHRHAIIDFACPVCAARDHTAAISSTRR